MESQARTVVESVHARIYGSILENDSFTDLSNCARSKAPHNWNPLITICLTGATRFLDVTSRVTV